MNKVLIHLISSLPEFEADVFVPDDLLIRDLVQLLVQAVGSISGSRDQSYNGELLCAARLGKVLAMEGTLEAYGIQNGDILYLI